MLSTTPFLYCKRAALHHAPDPRPIDPWALPPVPLSSGATPSRARCAEKAARLFHSQGLGNEVIRASVLFSCTRQSFHNCACARPWKNDLVQEATSVQPHDVPGPTPFVREGVFPGNAETACLYTPLRDPLLSTVIDFSGERIVAGIVYIYYVQMSLFSIRFLSALLAISYQTRLNSFTN